MVGAYGIDWHGTLMAHRAHLLIENQEALDRGIELCGNAFRI
jgi:hypothetical protein